MYKVSEQKMSDLLKMNFFITKRPIFKYLWIGRLYGNKELHPIGYHIILPILIKIT